MTNESGRRAEVPALSPKQVAEFHRTVREWYRANRRSMPWRETEDPYAILVSEIMLQQTRVERVLSKYPEFLARFPDIASLAAAPLDAVLETWQGLGYNRRALALKRCAEAVANRHGGNLPVSVAELEALPGIGPYTARAIATFAFGMATPFIETNIRAVFLHHFFADRQGVTDRELLPLVELALDRRNPREWQYALMDYGVMLKKTYANPARRSAHHSRQSPFPGSNRELRSRILRLILAEPGIAGEAIVSCLQADPERIRDNLVRMEREGFIGNVQGRYSIRPHDKR